MNEILPTIGRIVLYRDKDLYDKEQPAIITRVWDVNVVNLTVFADGLSPKPESSVTYNEVVAVEDRHNWRWPPREHMPSTGNFK